MDDAVTMVGAFKATASESGSRAWTPMSCCRVRYRQRSQGFLSWNGRPCGMEDNLNLKHDWSDRGGLVGGRGLGRGLRAAAAGAKRGGGE